MNLLGKKIDMSISYGSSGTTIFHQCGVCGCFVTEKYIRHMKEHFNKKQDVIIYYGLRTLSFYNNNAKLQPMRLVAARNFLDYHFGENSFKKLVSALKNSIKITSDFKTAFDFNLECNEWSEGAHRYYMYIDEDAKTAYVGSSNQYLKQRRINHPPNVKQLSYGSNSSVMILGYVRNQIVEHR